MPNKTKTKHLVEEVATTHVGSRFRVRRVIACLCLLINALLLLELAISVGVGPGIVMSGSGAWGWRAWLLWAAFMGRTFAFHAAIGTVVLAAVGALAARRRRWLPALLAAACVVIAWPEVRFVVPRASGTRGGETLRVQSMNLLFLSHDWKKVLAQIEAADADVVLMQEYHQDWDLALYPKLHEKYPYECRPLREGVFGQAVYSKRPFVGEPVLLRLHHKDYCPQIGVTVEVGGREVEIWDIHLISPSGPEEIERQWEQMGVLEAPIQRRHRPLVLMGDFNSTTMSWNSELLRSLDLVEANAAVGRGRGATWPVYPVLSYLPGVRIDQAWGNAEIGWVSSRVGGETGSDHLPNVVEFVVK